MNKYTVIADEQLLNDFIDWLPQQKEDETYYCCLFGRKKYDPSGTLKADKSQLKRFNCDKANMLNKIKQLECEVGTYFAKGLVVPNEALALYITPNPRSLVIAARETLVELARAVTSKYNGYNPKSMALDKIQVSCGSKKYLDFDYDGVSVTEIAERISIGRIINPDALTYVKTRGGFHLLVELEKVKSEFKKGWHQGLAGLPGCDVRGDNLLPVVGCYQGGFVPHFVFP